MTHITPDVTEVDIILPAIHFSNHGHVQRRKEDRHQWMTQEAANVAMNKQSGQAWDREFDAGQPQQIAPHYHHSTALQTILP